MLTYITVSSSQDIAGVDDVTTTVPAMVIFLEITISHISHQDISQSAHRVSALHPDESSEGELPNATVHPAEDKLSGLSYPPTVTILQPGETQR